MERSVVRYIHQLVHIFHTTEYVLHLLTVVASGIFYHVTACEAFCYMMGGGIYTYVRTYGSTRYTAYS